MRYFLVFALGLGLSGCATLQPEDFPKSKQRFKLDQYFDGHCRSWGVFENTGGGPCRYFTCDNRGIREQAGDLTLTQHFSFSDGKKQLRVWHIHRVDSTHWQATANDLVGVALGECEGNALYWEYRITLNRKNPLATVHVRQWLYEPEGTTNLLSRLVISKLGVTVFEVSEVIHRVTEDSRR